MTPNGKVLVSADSHGAVILLNLAPSRGETQCFQTYLFDPQATPSNVRGLAYNASWRGTSAVTREEARAPLD